MHLPEALIWITVFGGFTLKNCLKFVFFINFIIFFLVCPFMTAMTGDKGGGGPIGPHTHAWIRWINFLAWLGLNNSFYSQNILSNWKSMQKMAKTCQKY